MEQNNPANNDLLKKIREARKAASNQTDKASSDLKNATQDPAKKSNPLLKFVQKPQTNTAFTQPDTFSNPVPREPQAEQGFSTPSPLVSDGYQTVTKPLPNPSKPSNVRTLDQFKPSLPVSEIPSQNPTYRILGDRDLSREETMQMISQAKSMKDLERLQVDNDPEVMQGFEKRINEFKNQSSQTQVPAEKPVIDKPWWEDTWDGIRSGTRSALSALYEGGSEIADYVGTGGPMNPNSIGQYNMIKQLQAKGLRGAGLGAGLREMADTEKKRADIINSQADTESIGFFAGQMMPYVAGSAAAIASAPISAPLAAGLGTANVGALALASVGSGLQTYDQYKAEKGQEVDPYARLGVGLLYGGAEFAMERLSLNKLMPKQFKGKVASAMFGAVPGEVMEKEAKQLVEEFANSNSSRKAMIDGLLKDTGKGVIVEGSTEAATEVAQEFTNWLYYEKEDRGNWEELAKNTATAFAGGALMGAGLGPLSYGSQRLVNNKRREQAGKVVIAQNSNTGEAVEIVGISGQKPKSGKKSTSSGSVEGTVGSSLTYDVIRPNGRVAQLTEDEVGEVIELPTDVFKGLLNGKVDGQSAVESRLNQEIGSVAQNQEEEFKAKYEPYTYNDPINGQMIAMGKRNGVPVYIKTQTPNGFLIVDEEGVETLVPQQALTEVTQMPFGAFLETNAPVSPETAPPFDPTNPIQVGEPINYQDENWIVTGIDMDSGTIQLESEDSDGIFETVPVDLLQQLRKPKEELLQESTMDLDSTGAGKLRNIFSTGDQVKLETKESKLSDSSPFMIQETLDNVASKLGIPAFKAGSVHFSKAEAESRKWLVENLGEKGDEIADIMEFPQAANRLIDRIIQTKKVDSKSNNSQTTTINEPIQQTEPQQQTGQIDVQEEKNQENSTEASEGQKGLEGSGINQNEIDRINSESQWEDVKTASTSEDLAELYDVEVQNLEGINPIDNAIAQVIGKVNPESYARFGDRNNISKGSAGNWISKKGTGKQIDLIAQEASDFYGGDNSVSTQDVIDFMEKFTSAENITQPSGNPKLKEISDKYFALTGKKLNKSKAAKIRKELKGKSISKNDKGELLESDDQIADYLSNNPSIGEFLSNEFSNEDGSLNYEEALKILDTDPDWFTVFPGGFKENEVNSIRTILTNKLNEQSGNQGTNSAVSPASEADGGNQSRNDLPEAENKVDQTGSGVVDSREQQKPDSTDPQPTGEPKSRGRKSSRSNPSSSTVKLDEKAQKLTDELKDLWGQFGAGDKLRSGVSGQDFELAGKIIAKSAELGLVKFEQIINWVGENLGQETLRQKFDSFKAAYAAQLIFNNPQNEDLNAISKKKADDFIVEEKSEQTLFEEEVSSYVDGYYTDKNGLERKIKGVKFYQDETNRILLRLEKGNIILNGKEIRDAIDNTGDGPKFSNTKSEQSEPEVKSVKNETDRPTRKDILNDSSNPFVKKFKGLSYDQVEKWRIANKQPEGKTADQFWKYYFALQAEHQYQTLKSRNPQFTENHKAKAKVNGKEVELTYTIGISDRRPIEERTMFSAVNFSASNLDHIQKGLHIQGYINNLPNWDGPQTLEEAFRRMIEQRAKESSKKIIPVTIDDFRITGPNEESVPETTPILDNSGLVQLDLFGNPINVKNAKPGKSTKNIQTLEDQEKSSRSKVETIKDRKSATKQLKVVDDLLSEIENELKLAGYYNAGDLADKNEYPHYEHEKVFKKDLVKFSKALAKELGWEHRTDKKGKPIYAQTNIAPAGGDGDFTLFDPNSNQGVYISVNVSPDYESPSDNDPLIIDGKTRNWGGSGGDNAFLWRYATKEQPYGDGQNRWADSKTSVAEFKKKILDQLPSASPATKPTSLTEMIEAGEGRIMVVKPTPDKVEQPESTSKKEESSSEKVELDPDWNQSVSKAAAAIKKLGLTIPKSKAESMFDPDLRLKQLVDFVNSYLNDTFGNENPITDGKQGSGSNGQVRPTSGQSTKREQTSTVRPNEGNRNSQEISSGEAGGNESTDGQTEGTGLRPDNSRGTGKRKTDGDSGNERVNDSEIDGFGKADQSKLEKKTKQRKKNEANFSIPEGFSYPDTFKVAERFDANIKAIELVVEMIKENRNESTPEEKQVLFGYSGFGGIPDIARNPNYTYERFDSDAMRSRVKKVYDLINEIDPDGKLGVLSSLKSSINTAHYTEPEIIRAHYDLISKMGFQSGKVLDPSSGIGNYFGSMPVPMSQDAILTGVEMDYLTSEIFRRMYPGSKAINKPLQDANIVEGTFDLAISNIPFGSTKIYDPSWKGKKQPIYRIAQQKIHNYFVVKMIESAKEGGLISILTSNAVMDTESNRPIRQYMADNTYFIGAVRLPNTAFKGASGTKVVTDILFLQKRKAGESVSQQNPFVESSTQTKDGSKYSLNEYFISNPQNILGEIVGGGQYDAETGYTVEGSAENLRSKIVAALEKSAVTINYSPANDIELAKDGRQTEAYSGKDTIRSGNVFEKNEDFYEAVERNSNGEFTGEKINVFKKYVEPFRDFISIRQSLNELIDNERFGQPDSVLDPLRKKLKSSYNKFNNNHGRLNEYKNVFSADIDSFQVLALEVLDEKGKFKGLADIFEKRTINPNIRPTSADNPQEAILISLNEYNKINPARMQELLGENWLEQSKGLLFELPNGTYESRDQYLSGDIWEKIQQVKDNPAFKENLTELEKVLPKPIPFELISIPLGARYVDIDVYNEFIKDTFNTRAKIAYLEGLDSYKMSFTIHSDEYSTSRINTNEVIEKAFSDQTIRINNTIRHSDGSTTTEFNPVETAAANAVVDKLKTAWKTWLAGKQDIGNKIAETYNRLFNSTVKRRFDGSHMTFPGLRGITPRTHQADGINMLVQNNGGIIDHVVGAGKTLIMVIGSMELKRLGVAKKPLIIGKKSTVPQIYEAFQKAYPGAKVLAPTDKDFTASKRKKILSQIAVNDWDAIILTHENYGNILPDPETAVQVMQEEIDLLKLTVEEMRGMEKSQMTRKEIKGMEKRIDNLTAKIKELSDLNKDTEIMDFGKLGIDHIMVDESQSFKNLTYSTVHNNVAGLGTKDGAKKTYNLLMGVRHLQKIHKGDKGTTFLSGTPISNTMAELYLILKYLRPNKLRELGISTFDAWAKTFAEKSSELEFGVSGALKAKERFRRFINVPELAKLYTDIADVRNDSNLKLPKPGIKGGKEDFVLIKPSRNLEKFYKKLIHYATSGDGSVMNIEGLDYSSEEAKKAKMLKITDLATKASIDLRLVYPQAPFDPNSKLANVAADIASVYKETAKHKGVALAFMDSGKTSQYNPLFNGEREIKRILIDIYGVKPDEIQLMADHQTDAKKEKLFKKVNKGEVRVLIGSTETMGTGVNVQERVLAMRHVDIPWRPSDYEQRNGRGLRQGNIIAEDFYNNEVDVKVYGVERSLDAYKFELLAIKQHFIDQIKNGATSDRIMDEGEGDEDNGASFSEFMAAATGNPIIKEKAKNDKLLDQLNTSRIAFANRQGRARAMIERYNKGIANAESVISQLELYNSIAQKTKINEDYQLLVGGKPYEKVGEAGDALLDMRPYSEQAIELMKKGGQNLTPQATANGWDLYVFDKKMIDGTPFKNYIIAVTDPETGKRYYPKSGELAQGSVYVANTLKKYVNSIENQILDNQSYIKDEATKYIEQSKKVLEEKWPDEEKYQKALADQSRIAAEVAVMNEQEGKKNAEDSDVSSPMFSDDDPNPSPDKPTFFKKPNSLSEMMDRASMRATINPVEKPASTKQVEQWANEISKNWETKPEIKVFDNASQVIKSFPELEEYKSEIAEVPGMMIRNPRTGATQVVLIASHSYLNNKEGVDITLLHEIIGHYGLREGLRQRAKGNEAEYIKKYQDLMDVIFEAKKNDPMMSDIASRYFGRKIDALTKIQQTTVADEYIAHLAQTGIKDTFTDRIISKFRELLRSIGIDLKFNDSDLLNLIGNSRRFVEGKRKVNGNITDGVKFIKVKQDQTQTPAFKAWFGNSKVVDENGEPKIMYHGTNNEFTEFKISTKGALGAGIYLTPYKEDALKHGKIAMPVYVKIENPKIVNNREEDTQLLGSSLIYRRKKGIETFDGVIDQYGQMLALDPTQIKSANGNNGDFDGTNPDIRFMKVSDGSMPTPVRKATEEVAKKSWSELATERLQDHMVMSKKLINEKTAGKDPVKDKADFYTKENLSKGRALVQSENFVNKYWNPFLETAKQIVKETGLKQSDISDYLKAKHHGERKKYFIDKERESFTAMQNAKYMFSPELQVEYSPLEWADKIDADFEKKIKKYDATWPTGMTDEWADETVSNFESTVAEKQVKTLNKQVKAMSVFVNKKRFTSGMISKTVYNELMTQYQNYVPLRDWAGLEGMNENVYSPLMSAKGRTSEAADPIPFLFTAAQEAIMRGENNLVRQSLLEFVKEHVSPGDYFIRSAWYVKTGEQDEFGNDIWKETQNKPTQAQIDSGDAMRSFDPDVHRSVQQQGERKNVLPVLVKGKKVFIEFKNSEIPMAMKNLNQEQVPGWLSPIRSYTRWLSSMYTQYSPEFGFRNLIRDMGFAGFNISTERGLKTAAKTYSQVAKSMKTLTQFFWNEGEYPTGKDGNYLKEYMEEGAMTGYSDLKEVKEIFETAKREIDGLNAKGWQGVKSKVGSGFETALKPIDVYNRTFENAMRFAYYKTLREDGVSKQQSAIAAKDLTVNFNRKGTWSAGLGSIYIFFNASVQGTQTLLSKFAKPETRKKAYGFAGSIMALGMIQSIILGLSSDDDDDGKTYYEKIPDYIRRNNIIIPLPKQGEYMKIPLPYGLNVFYAMGESLGRVITGQGKPGMEALGVASVASNAFSPLGGYDFTSDNQRPFQGVAQLFTPSALQPVTDLMLNQNFAGFPIYRENFTPTQYKRPDSQMYFEGVNPAIRTVTDALNSATGGDQVKSGLIDINPEWIEYGFEQYFGGPVQFGQNAYATLAAIAGGENILKDPYYRKVPLLRSFMQKSGTEYQIKQDYYTNYNEIQAAKQAYELYKSDGDTASARALLQEERAKFLMIDVAKLVNGKLKKINDQIGAIKERDAPGDNEKIEKLYDQRNQLMNKFNTLYYQRVTPKKEAPTTLEALFK